MRILITGASGFIGSALVDELWLRGYKDITLLVRNTSKVERFKDRNLKLIYGDIADYGSLSQIKEVFDVIFHCAAYVENKNWNKLYSANILGTKNICSFALEKGVKKLIYLSSVAVVSGNSQLPLTESIDYSYTNLYGKSKIEAEKIVIAFRDKGLKAAILRPCMVYGENEPHALALLLKLIRFRLFAMFNAGKSKLHLVYIGNVVEALIFCMENESCLKDSLFIADSEVLTSREVFSILASGLGVKAPLIVSEGFTKWLCKLPLIGEKIKFFLKDRVYSIEKIKSLGYSEKYPVRDSLLKTALYYRD